MTKPFTSHATWAGEAGARPSLNESTSGVETMVGDGVTAVPDVPGRARRTAPVGDEALFGEYAARHQSKGYWPNETPLEQVKE